MGVDTGLEMVEMFGWMGTLRWPTNRGQEEELTPDSDDDDRRVADVDRSGGSDRCAVMACIKLTGGLEVSSCPPTFLRGTVGRLGTGTGVEGWVVGVILDIKLGRFCLA